MSTTMDVRELTRITGVPTWITDAEVEAGNTGDGTFLFPNDGQILIILYAAAAGAGETMTFTGKQDKYGRVSSDLNFQVATGLTGLVGPFSPHLWNDVNGRVTFALTEKHADTKFLAVRITDSKTNGV